MAKSFMYNGGSGTSVTGGTTRYFVVGNAAPSSETTEGNAQIDWPTPGTFSKLAVLVVTHSDLGGSATTYFSYRQDEGAGPGDGNQVIAVGEGQTGEFEETDGITDHVDAGTLIDYQVDNSAGTTLNFTIIDVLFEPDDATETVVRHAATGFPDLSNGSTYYAAIADRGVTPSTVETQSKIGLNAAGAARQLQVNVSGSLHSATDVHLRKNASSNVITVSIAALTSGIFITTSSVDYALGDYINYSIVSVVGPALFIEIISVEYKTTTNQFHSIFASSGDSFLHAFNVNRYVSVGGGATSMESAESRTRIDANMAVKASNLLVYVVENTLGY